MKKIAIIIIGIFMLMGCTQETHTLYLDQTDLSKMETGWSTSKMNKSVEGNPLTIAGHIYDRGVGTHAVSKMLIDLHGNGKRFSAVTGVDDESGDNASVEFFVLGDGKVLWKSGIMKKGDEPRQADVNLKNIRKMALYVSDGGDNINYDHADWAGAVIEYYGNQPPVAIMNATQKAYILTPPPPETPRINYPRVYGAGTGKPFLFRIPATGKPPMRFKAEGLPGGLRLDENTGIISGQAFKTGIYDVAVTAENSQGRDVS